MIVFLFFIVIVGHLLCRHLWLFLRCFISSDAMVLQEYPVERERQRFQRLLPHLRFQFTFPNGDAVPAHRSQLMLHSRVPLLIPPNLCHPEVTVRLRNLAALRIVNFFAPLAFWRGGGGEAHIVSMPETPVHKDARPVFSHHDVRLPRQSRMIQPIPIPMSPQPTAHHHLRLRVLAVDGCHVSVTLLGRQTI